MLFCLKLGSNWLTDPRLIPPKARLIPEHPPWTKKKRGKIFFEIFICQTTTPIEWQYQRTLQKKVIHSLHISISVEKNNQLNITCYLRRSPAFFVHCILGSLVRVTWTVHFLWFDSLWEKIITFLLLDSKNQSQSEKQKSRPFCRIALSTEDHLVLRLRSPAWGVNKDISHAGFSMTSSSIISAKNQMSKWLKRQNPEKMPTDPFVT